MLTINTVIPAVTLKTRAAKDALRFVLVKQSPAVSLAVVLSHHS